MKISLPLSLSYLLQFESLLYEIIVGIIYNLIVIRVGDYNAL